MAVIISFCSSTGKNTGKINCDVQLANLRFGFIGGAKFTPAEYATEATLKAALRNRLNRANGDPEKLYPWALANAVDKTTEEDTTETAADGYKRVLRTAPESYVLNQWTVGINQEAAMIAFNNTTIPFFAVDDSFKFVGKFDSDSNLVGNNVNIVTKGAGFSIFTAGANTRTTISFTDPYALNVNARLFEFTEFDFEDFTGLLDAELKTLAAPTGNAHKIGAYVYNRSINKNKNLYDLYADELADPVLWVGYTAAGAQVAPTGVVKDTSLKGWTVTFGVAVAAVDLASPATLYAANVKGIEGVRLDVA